MVIFDQVVICDRIDTFDRDTIIVGNAFVGGLGSLCGIGKDESHGKNGLSLVSF